jgi:hypothetical protein
MGNRIPMKFVPDPHIPGAAESGIGDLHFDDGTVNFIEDPEMAGLVNQYPDTVDEINAASARSGALVGDVSLDEGPPAPPPALPGAPPDPNGDFMPWTPQPGATGTPEATGFAPSPPVTGSEPTIPDIPQEVADERERAGELAKGDKDDAFAVNEPAPDAAVAGMGAPAAVAPPSLQVTERTGRLDPEVAARQAEERGASNVQSQLDLQKSRDAEFGAERADIRDQRIRLRAQMEEQQAQQQVHQQKLNRFRDEERTVADSKIESDLIHAEGPGALLSVIGAALLGATGSDSGLRMIDNAINRHVQKQISRRDSKLRVIADQIGSEEQAVQMAKSKYYEAAANHAEQLQRLTKSDAYAKMTPVIVGQLRAKQLEASQAAERESLGKSTETLQGGPKELPWQQVKEYGEKSAAQAEGSRNVSRAANALGLTGYDPKTGRFANRDEVLKNGIPGVGKIDSFLKDLGRLPVVGALPQALDTALTSKEGVAIRSSLEGLISAEAMKQNPGRAPTDADRMAAAKTLGLDTEEGTIRAVERAMGQQEEARDRNVAAYGTRAAGQYEGTFQGQGGGRDARGTGGGESTATSDDIAAELQRRKTGGGEQPKGTIADVRGAIAAQAGKELPPEGQAILLAQASHETDGGKHFVGNNFFGHKAKGDEASVTAQTTEGGGKNQKGVPGKFRAFSSAEESVSEHIDLLKRKYPAAWKALQAGDENAFAAALKDGGYYTDDESTYVNGLRRWIDASP